MERDHEVRQRIARSNAITASRTKRMEERDTLLRSLIKEAYAQVTAISLYRIRLCNLELFCLSFGYFLPYLWAGLLNFIFIFHLMACS